MRFASPLFFITLVAACSSSSSSAPGAGAACVNAGGTCFVGGAVCTLAPDAAQDCNPDRAPAGGVCCLGAAASDAGAQDSSTDQTAPDSGGNEDASGNADASGIADASETADAAADSPCIPQTCAHLGYDCGVNGDGCGNMIDCGTCTAPDYCGGGGFSRCGTGPSDGCQKSTCVQLGFDCGPAPDGCGGVLDCGTCTPPQFCGGGGANQCGGPGGVDSGGCQKMTCQQLGYDCGLVSDGCGGIQSCGTCPSGQVCGAGGFSRCG